MPIKTKQNFFIQKSSSDSLRGFQSVKQKPMSSVMRPGKTRRDRLNKLNRLARLKSANDSQLKLTSD